MSENSETELKPCTLSNIVDVALQDAMVDFPGGSNYDDELFVKSLAGNGYEIVPIRRPLPSEGRRLGLEEAAKVADEMADNEREEKLADKEAEGKDYDPYSYGAGFLDGAWVTARNLAAAIRSLSHDGKAPDKEGEAG
ncbi:hypothetical protein [Reyranella sp.]|uniref:hypothetical protein n=1 Tax=Reyranella sp. TaxID=1929291 RepID=UPI0040351741